MSAVAIGNARQTVPAPVRKPRRNGLFSVAEVIDGGEQHWMLGGLQADGEECSKPSSTGIVCGPTPNKAMRSWYSDIDADPWLAYMYESCKTVGRYSESAERLRTRFLAAEQSAAEAAFQDNVLGNATVIGTGFDTVPIAISQLEDYAASEYGGQIIIHLGFIAASAAWPVIERVEGHLETKSGNLVSVGNYHPDHDGGTATAPVVYATGATTLYRSGLAESGPVFDSATNDYFTLIERGYAALVDCLLLSASGTLCGCAGPATVLGTRTGGTTLTDSDLMAASTLGIQCGSTNSQAANSLNDKGVSPEPSTAWADGHCAYIDCGGDVDRAVRWDGNQWVGC